MKKITYLIIFVLSLGVGLITSRDSILAYSETVCDWNLDGLITSDDVRYSPDPNIDYECEIITGGIYPDEQQFNEAIEITSYTDLDYIENGQVFIHSTGFNENSDRVYDLIFSNGYESYIKRNVTLPPVYDYQKYYNVTYRVLNVENVKRVFINFKDSEGFEIEWEVTSGDYLANNVIRLTNAELERRLISQNLGFYKFPRYYLHFNTDLPVDKIYRIKLKYETYTEFFGNINNQETVEKVIYEKELAADKFTLWLNKIIDMNLDNKIEESNKEDFAWSVFIDEFGGTSAHLGNVELINLYYVTNGHYYEQDFEPHDPINAPEDQEENSMDKIIQFITNFENAIDWISNNVNLIGWTLSGLFAIYVFPYILKLFTMLIKIIFTIISIVFKVIVFILKLPLMIFSLFGSGNKSKYKYKY